MHKERLNKLVTAFAEFFEDDEVPEDFRFERQSFYERCEGWILHAMEQVEEELGDPDEDEQTKQG